MVRRISLNQFIGVLQDLPEELEGAIIRALRSAAAQLQSTVAEEIMLTQPQPVDTGEMLRSTDTMPLPKGARIFNDAPHAAVMEWGARPFRPPVEPLKRWALRKRIADTEEEAERVAWAVAGRIEAQGIKPRHFFKRAMDRAPEVIYRELEAELAKL